MRPFRYMILPPMTKDFFDAKLTKSPTTSFSMLWIESVKIVMYLINISLTFLLVNRWLISGHFPLSNLYESLIFLSWSFSTIYSITSFTLRGEAKATLLPTIGWSVAPVTLLTCAYAFFCIPQELQKAESLVPALQSNWLIMHVSVMILSYASLILGSLFAFSLLLIVHFEMPLEIFNLNRRIQSKQTMPSQVAKHGLYLSKPFSNWLNSFLEFLIPPITSLISNGSQFHKPSIAGVVLSSDKTVIVSETKLHSSELKIYCDTVNPVNPADLLDLKDLKQTRKNNTESLIYQNKKAQENVLTVVKNNNLLDNLSYRFIGLGFALLTLGLSPERFGLILLGAPIGVGILKKLGHLLPG